MFFGGLKTHQLGLMFGEVGLFDKVGDAPVEIDENLVSRFGEFVFAVVDVVVSEHL
jgi:hypothetical protein